MKKIIILLCGIIILEFTYIIGSNILLKDNFDKTFSITIGNKNCVPVKLNLYDNGQYELFTYYLACKADQTCNDVLKYTKSIKGKYDYDIMKILEDDSIQSDKTHLADNLPEYEIYLGNYYVNNGYEYYYTVENGQVNKYLDEFLRSINVNLNRCAKPEYID